MRTVLRGANVVDGTGVPGVAADVVIDGERIAEITAPGVATGEEVVDLTGLVLAPGFIDPHTHYDAQILWDGDLTPSVWHGVTSVVMGNCGFGVAPTRPEHRGVIARTLENVEGMSVEALEAGITWDFETFPEYLDSLRSRPMRLNVGVLLGHTPLRLYVLGEDSTEREATDAEIAEMRAHVLGAMEAGALGFATSKSQAHVGDAGKPVPSRAAGYREVQGLADALGDFGRGVVQATWGPGLQQEELSELSERTGAPVTWTAVATGLAHVDVDAIMARHRELGGEVYPQVACRPIVFQANLADPFPFAPTRAFKEILAVERAERAGLYADPAWRERARTSTERMWGHRWSKVSVAESDAHPELVGAKVEKLAADRGVHPIDVMCDISLADGLTTRFEVIIGNDDIVKLAELMQGSETLLGLSDAGAHASQLCDACYSTFLLGTWVRERKALSLEHAIWRLTAQPAKVFRLEDRGVIAAGNYADLVAFDPDTVGVGKVERVWDLPAGADRLVAHSTGVEATWVNGTLVRWAGDEVDGARPGVLLSPGPNRH